MELMRLALLPSPRAAHHHSQGDTGAPHTHSMQKQWRALTGLARFTESQWTIPLLEFHLLSHVPAAPANPQSPSNSPKGPRALTHSHHVSVQEVSSPWEAFFLLVHLGNAHLHFQTQLQISLLRCLPSQQTSPSPAASTSLCERSHSALLRPVPSGFPMLITCTITSVYLPASAAETEGVRR